MKKLLLLLIFIPSLLISQSIENFGNSEKTYYENGNLFSEKINNTKNNSTGHIVYWEDGKTKMGEFQFDQKGNYIYMKYFYSNGLINQEINYIDGKIISEKCWDKYGLIMQCKNENHNGRSTTYWDNGEKMIEGFKINGKWNGQVTSYFESGNIMGVETWEDGIIVGTSKYYYENGKYKFILNNNGEKKQWHITGELEHEGQLINGYETGIWVYYNKDGTVAYNISWSDGQAISSTVYYNDGRYFQGNMVGDGVPHGIWELFDSSGNLIKQVRLDNGNIVE